MSRMPRQSRERILRRARRDFAGREMALGCRTPFRYSILCPGYTDGANWPALYRTVLSAAITTAKKHRFMASQRHNHDDSLHVPTYGSKYRRARFTFAVQVQRLAPELHTSAGALHDQIPWW